MLGFRYKFVNFRGEISYEVDLDIAARFKEQDAVRRLGRRVPRRGTLRHLRSAHPSTLASEIPRLRNLLVRTSVQC